MPVVVERPGIYYSLSEAAERAGIDRQLLHYHVRTHSLESVVNRYRLLGTPGPRAPVLIEESELERFIKEWRSRQGNVGT